MQLAVPAESPGVGALLHFLVEMRTERPECGRSELELPQRDGRRSGALTPTDQVLLRPPAGSA